MSVNYDRSGKAYVRFTISKYRAEQMMKENNIKNEEDLKAHIRIMMDLNPSDKLTLKIRKS